MGDAREGAGTVAKAVSTAAKIAMPPEKFRGATQKFRGSAGKFGASKFPSGASVYLRDFRFTTGGGISRIVLIFLVPLRCQKDPMTQAYV